MIVYRYKKCVTQYPLPGRGCPKGAGEEFGQEQAGTNKPLDIRLPPVFLIRPRYARPPSPRGKVGAARIIFDTQTRLLPGEKLSPQVTDVVKI